MFNNGIFTSAKHDKKFFPMLKGVIMLANQKANEGKLQFRQNLFNPMEEKIEKNSFFPSFFFFLDLLVFITHRRWDLIPISIFVLFQKCFQLKGGVHVVFGNLSWRWSGWIFFPWYFAVANSSFGIDFHIR